MEKPSQFIVLPYLVLEYADVGSGIEFKDRRKLWLGDRWLGSVPRLAICKNLETQEFALFHCSKDWIEIVAVETFAVRSEAKAEAEKHYPGVSVRWKMTGFSESEGMAVHQRDKDESSCSFCERSPYYDGVESMVSKGEVRICNLCLESMRQSLVDEAEPPN